MTAIKDIKKLLASGDEDAVAEAVRSCGDLEPEVFLQSGENVPWLPSWRVKRDHVPLALSGIARMMAASWGGAFDQIAGLVPPASWTPEMLEAGGERVERIELGGSNVTLVRVEGGTFEMGRHAGSIETGWQAPEQIHEVAITRDYFMGATPITRGQLAALRGTNPPEDPELPATLSHRDALRACNELSERAGLPKAYDEDDGFRFRGFDSPGYRLPSEAEWERAARAGSKTATYNGNLKNGNKSPRLALIAWYSGNAGSPRPVATRLPNRFGLYDMLGNVHEWCMDAFADPAIANEVDPLVVRAGERVVRGGSCRSRAGSCLASTRMGSKFADHVGLRVVRTASESKPERIAFVREPPAKPEWAHVVLELESHPRCLGMDAELVFIGTAGGIHSPENHQLIVFDRERGEARHRHRTPFLVSSLISHFDVWLGLGPGHIMVSRRRGSEPPVHEGQVTNAPMFASSPEALAIGTTYEGFHVDSQHFQGVAKTMRSLAINDDHVFAAYDDDKVRVFDRNTGKRTKTLPGRSVAARGELLFTGGARVVRWDPTTFEEVGEIPHAAKQPWIVPRICGTQVVTRSHDGVQVQRAGGEEMHRWEPIDPEIYVWDAMAIGDQLWIGVGDKGRSSGRVLAVPTS